ncbi:uncharacterized protein LOC123011747 [Tribolium madens]|uniref:uncharacterized protein LOC123011747 n=1 Tax=Tribolium madens TaxID=41895 RepID=UPI001CF75760|nr:uncharacterized protein LOC123011747 [Tribolium madens]
MDGCLLKCLSNYLNFSFLIDESHPTHGRVLKNGTITGSLSDVVFRKVDFSANDWFLIDYQTREIEVTVPFSYDQVCPVVPKALKVPQWKAFFFIFDVTSWVLFFFMWICCIFVWVVLNSSRDLATVTWEMCAVLFGNPVNVVPLPHQYMFLGSCMVLNIIIMGIIQGSVFTDFTTTTFHKDINTLLELDQAGLQIASSAWYLDFDTTDLIKSLKTKQIRNYKGSYKDAAYTRKLAVLGRKQDVEHIVKVEFVAEDGSPLLHVTNECLQTFLLVSVFPKGSPFLTTFNHAITKLFEAGLTVKWYQDVMSTDGPIKYQARVLETHDRKIQSQENVLKHLSVFQVGTLWALGTTMQSSSET